MESTSISIRNYTVADCGVEPAQVTAEGGARCPRLLLPFIIRQRSSPPWTAEGKVLTLIAVEYELRAAGGLRRQLGQGCICPAQDLLQDSSIHQQLPINLDPYRVREIEQYRASRDLDLHLGTKLVVGLPPKVPRTVTGRETGANWVLAEIAAVQAELTFQIPRSTWIERILPQLHNSNCELVEFPLGGGRVKLAGAYLEAAEAAFYRWDTKSVYANCREMATALDTAVRQEFATDKFMTEDRWGRAFERFNHLASLDLHLENIKKSAAVDAEQVKIDRRDTECLLLTAKILLKYANDLLPNG